MRRAQRHCFAAAGPIAHAQFVAQRGAVSATVWDWSITPGGSWDGQVSQAVWSGPIQLFSAGTINVGVVEA